MSLSTFTYVHAGCMFVGWGVFGTLGLNAARMRSSNHRWFLPHWLPMLVTMTLSCVGFLFALAAKGWALIEWNWEHKYLGIFIISSALLQGVSGLLAHLFWKPDRQGPTIWDRFHGFLGRGTWLVSLYQMWVGLGPLTNNWSIEAVTGTYAAYMFYIAMCISHFMFSDVAPHSDGKSAYITLNSN
jgi:hypothetical protein